MGGSGGSGWQYNSNMGKDEFVNSNKEAYLRSLAKQNGQITYVGRGHVAQYTGSDEATKAAFKNGNSFEDINKYNAQISQYDTTAAQQADGAAQQAANDAVVEKINEPAPTLIDPNSTETEAQRAKKLQSLRYGIVSTIKGSRKPKTNLIPPMLSPTNATGSTVLGV